MGRARAVTLCLLTALALSGCMRHPAPVAAVPHSDLDALAYGGRPMTAPSAYRGPPPRAYAAPVVYAAAPAPVMHDPAYRLDAGDRLRIVVYGQEGLTNTYLVDAGGHITMPLIGSVQARGKTPAELAAAIAARLRNGYIREPYVAAEIEAYRPFFILGEVAAPGQYPFVPNMTIESAVAIAGGFSPRAKRDRVTVTHTDARGTVRLVVPTTTALSPGDTIVVGERWF
jgi:polysaccharide export outer membrane protein